MSSLSKKLDDLKIEDILEKVRTYIDDEEQIKSIVKAYEFALDKHNGQFRKSGEAYIYHPMNVALILTSVYADYETICAGLLHEVIDEDCCTADDVLKEFGAEITKLVKGCPLYTSPSPRDRG